jgi:hypothetical protein
VVFVLTSSVVFGARGPLHVDAVAAGLVAKDPCELVG